MSSYFDAAQSKLARLLEEKKPFAEHHAVVTAALDRYEAYLRWVETQLRVPDRAQLERFSRELASIREAQGGVEGMAHKYESDAIMWCSEHLQDLHSLAHKLGGARLLRRDGAPIMDNPYWDDHVDRPE